MSKRIQWRWLLLGILCFAPVSQADSVSRKDFFHPTEGMQGDERYVKKFVLGRGFAADVIIDVTAKGNGYMNVLNLHLKVFDDHDDGAIYDGGLLHIDFVDLGEDGLKDLVISGLVIYTGEKENSPHSTESIVFIYRFQPKQRAFKLVYKRASFDLADGPSNGNKGGGPDAADHRRK